MTKPPLTEHPDDRADREQAQRECAEHEGAILSANRDRLLADMREMLTTYADAGAEEVLARVREWFWAVALPGAVRRRGKK